MMDGKCMHPTTSSPHVFPATSKQTANKSITEITKHTHAAEMARNHHRGGGATTTASCLVAVSLLLLLAAGCLPVANAATYTVTSTAGARFDANV
jgi:hypothetical protein